MAFQQRESHVTTGIHYKNKLFTFISKESCHENN